MKAKLQQKITGVVHEPLFQLFIDTRKAYNSLCRGICIEIIRGYGLGPKIQRLLHRYWDGQKVVLKAGNCLGIPSTQREELHRGTQYPQLFLT